MIIRLIAAFGVLLLSMYLGIWLQRDPGYVLIMFQHWTIESSFWVAILAIIILLIVLQLGFSIIKSISSMPQYLLQWRATHRLSRAQAKTKRGLIEFGEGQWQTAKKHLIAGAANTDQPLVNYLTAAKAAEKLGDHHLRDHYLHLAQTAAPDATIAIEL
ncbi:MAG: protoporphyrinogen oxidase, partial [Gammaproteobacteria bacterium]|nr:protoporphyrinogen oxidase [Gammaproteobacteria bacterium]